MLVFSHGSSHYEEVMNRKKAITVIGAGVIDVLAGPASPRVFETGSEPVDFTKLTFGGDALNEAVVLSRLGKEVDLISLVGGDEAGERVVEYVRKNGMDTDHIKVVPELATGVNIVLVDSGGERHFLTNPRSSLRKLSEPDILPYVDGMADLVSFASMFVSPLLDIPAMERLFRRIKEKEGRTLVVDLTKAKRNERLEDLAPLFPYIDYLLPNEAELAILTGSEDTKKNLDAAMELGASCVILKRGRKGCTIRREGECLALPAYPVRQVVDTTGAGDCFAAGFLWGLSEGMPLENCCRFGCAAASCSVETAGATEGISTLELPWKRYLESIQ